jgi:acyl carrier protein
MADLKNDTANDSQILEKVKDIIAEQLGVAKDMIKSESHFVDDFGADSLDQVEIIMRFEEEFDIDIPDDVAEKMLTVGDVVNHITENM